MSFMTNLLSGTTTGITAGLQAANLGLQGAATGLEVQGHLKQGETDAFNIRVLGESRARQSEAEANAKLFNAMVKDQQIDATENKYAVAAADSRFKTSSAIASRRASESDGGLEISSGSKLMVDTAIFQRQLVVDDRLGYASTLETSRLRDSARMDRWSANNDRINAKFSRDAAAVGAENAITASRLRATGASIRGASNTAASLASPNGFLSTLETLATKKPKSPSDSSVWEGPTQDGGWITPPTSTWDIPLPSSLDVSAY